MTGIRNILHSASLQPIDRPVTGYRDNTISTVDKFLSITDLSPWQSGGNLQPKMYQYRAQFVL